MVRREGRQIAPKCGQRESATVQFVILLIDAARLLERFYHPSSRESGARRGPWS
jgi:hypothetical protein